MTALETLADIPARVAELAAQAEASPDKERTRTLRRLLRVDVHDAVMRAAANGAAFPDVELSAIADSVRHHVPDGVEDGIRPRVGVFVRLLRRGAFAPAWALAHDNASGVVRTDRSVSTWAGGSYLNTELPLPTVVEGEHVYTWLPGFRDPRWSVPDEVYLVDHHVVLRGDLDEAVIDRGRLSLYGSAYLGLLTARPDDVVSVILTGTGGRRHEVVATRARRPDHVKRQGPDLARLEWTGWHAAVDLAALAGDPPSRWTLRFALDQGGVHRSAPLGARRGPLAEPADPPFVHHVKGASVRWELGDDDRLGLRFRPLNQSPRARLSRAVRRVRPRVE